MRQQRLIQRGRAAIRQRHHRFCIKAKLRQNRRDHAGTIFRVKAQCIAHFVFQLRTLQRQLDVARVFL